MSSRVSDTFPAAGLLAARPASGVMVPQFYSATDTGIIYRWDGATWAEWSAPGAGGGALAGFDSATRTAGDITLNQTAITAVDTALDLVVPAAVGDLLEFNVSGKLSPDAQYVGLDVYTMDGATRVNPFGAGLTATLSGAQGVPGWFGTNVATALSLTGSATHIVVVGDVFTGLVTMRFFYAKVNTTPRVLSAVAATPLKVWVKNYGPV